MGKSYIGDSFFPETSVNVDPKVACLYYAADRKYNIDKLGYYEVYDNILLAIQREKQLKKYYRYQKLELIELFNPEWNDLYYEII